MSVQTAISILDAGASCIAVISAYIGLRIWKDKVQYPEKRRAAIALFGIVLKITPESTPPGTVRSDVCGMIAENFEGHTKTIRRFLTCFPHVISRNTRDLLLQAIEIAEGHKGEATKDSQTGILVPNDKARKAADEFDKKVQVACDEVLRDLQS